MQHRTEPGRKKEKNRIDPLSPDSRGERWGQNQIPLFDAHERRAGAGWYKRALSDEIFSSYLYFLPYFLERGGGVGRGILLALPLPEPNLAICSFGTFLS